jgi:methyl-accepting chemotaxis protein
MYLSPKTFLRVDYMSSAIKNYRLGIGKKAFICLIAICLFSLAGWGVLTYNVYISYIQSQKIKTVNDITDILIDFATSVQSERGKVNTALNSNDVVSSAKEAEIIALQASSNSHLEKVLESLAPEVRVEKEVALRNLNVSIDRFKSYRQLASSAVKLPKSQRNSAIIDGWYEEATAVIFHSKALWSAFGREIILDDGRIGQLTELKEMGFDLRESAGRERAILEVAIATNQRLTQAQLQDAMRYQGQVDVLWSEAKSVALALASKQSELNKSIVNAQKLHFEVYNAARQSVIKASTEGTPYPFNIAGWRQVSDPAMASLLAIKSIAVAETADIASKNLEQSKNQLILLGSIMAVGVAITAIVLVFICKTVVKALSKITKVINSLAQNNVDIKVPFTRKNDEFGDIARSVQIFKQNLLDNTRLETEKKAYLVEQGERQVLVEGYIKDFEAKMHHVFDTIISSINTVETSTIVLTSAATKTAESTSEAEHSSNLAAVQMTSMAEMIAGLNQSMAELSARVTETSAVISEAAASAGTADMETQVLTQSAQRIGLIVELITSIASKTNLLALNAAIEAARAGDAGRGFAVVASEVKSLATQTTQGTQDISSQISSIQGAANNAVATINEIGQKLNNINAVGISMASAIEEQSTATSEISKNVKQTEIYSNKALKSIAKVNDAVIETYNAVEDTKNASTKLIEEAKVMRNIVSGFLNLVRAA